MFVDVVAGIVARYPDVINVLDWEGQTALHQAVRQDLPAVTTVLLQAGASPALTTRE